ncbi:MAG: DUF3426 domain-containing protein [Burkholderiaceae bacterium]|nr:DUF3426 domain-containing protein [Burkholderiaceae bacterium]
MALATRCPNCQALFRVVADQLKLRGGLVRCGACRHVFDAIGSLTYVDDAAPAGGASTPATAKAAAPLTLRISPERLARPKPAARDDERARAPDAQRAPVRPSPAEAGQSNDSERADKVRPSIEEEIAESSVPTLLAPGVDALGREPVRAEPSDAGDEDEEERARAERRRRRVERRTRETRAEGPADAGVEETAVGAEAAPDFLRRGERRTSTGFSVVFGGGSALLAVLLLAQLAVVFRIELATRWPSLRPSLVQLCGAFGCAVGWPARADLLAVVGTELQAIPGTDVLELTAVVRNRANFKVALPAIEVTLTDTQNRALARKVFAPVDYLASAGEPSSRIDEGLAAGSDYTIRIAFEARGLAAVGFVVYPFYL